jgi:hypothetical protein
VTGLAVLAYLVMGSVVLGIWYRVFKPSSGDDEIGSFLLAGIAWPIGLAILLLYLLVCFADVISGGRIL